MFSLAGECWSICGKFVISEKTSERIELTNDTFSIYFQKVVIKHLAFTSNCVRWDRAVVRHVVENGQMVRVYLPDTIEYKTLSFSSVFAIENSVWESFRTTHIIGLYGGVPLVKDGQYGQVKNFGYQLFFCYQSFNRTLRIKR